jgi:hypothetical protein
MHYCPQVKVPAVSSIGGWGFFFRPIQKMMLRAPHASRVGSAAPKSPPSRKGHGTPSAPSSVAGFLCDSQSLPAAIMRRHVAA